jgi:hypothetical protein
MAFRVPGAAGQPDAADPAPLTAGGYTVGWTRAYRYLGYEMRTDLSESHITNSLRGKLWHNLNRYYYGLPHLRKGSVALQLEVVKSLAIGSINYLRSLVALSPSQCAKLDSVLKRVARHALRLPACAPNMEVWSRSKLLPVAAICARERYRLLLQLQHARAQDGLAARLYRALLAEPRRPGQPSPTGNWVHWAWHQVRAPTQVHAATGSVAVAPQPRDYADIAAAAGVHARSVALRLWRIAGMRHNGVTIDAQPRTLDARPMGLGPAQHAADLHLHFRFNGHDLGSRQYNTPLSASGPGCSGSIVALSTVTATAIPHLLRARLGRLSLFLFPYAAEQDSLLAGHDSDSDASSVASQEAEEEACRVTGRDSTWRKRAMSPAACRLCGGADEDVYHLVCECTDSRVAAAQERAAASAPACVALIFRLGQRALDATRSPKRGDPSRDRDAAADSAPSSAAIDRLLRHHNWRSDSGKRLLFWLATATTWPMAAAPVDWHLARRLGRLFDALNVPAHLLRRLANGWCRWAERTLADLARARLASLQVADGL